MSFYSDDIADTMNSTDKRRLCLPLGDEEEDPNQECPSNDFTTVTTKRSGKNKLAHGAGLSTPDTASLALTSPELENIIISGSHTFLVSNGPGLTPTACGANGNSYTEQQMRYSQGFIEALQFLHSRSTQASGCDGNRIHSISTETHDPKQRHSSGSTVMSGEINSASNCDDDFHPNDSDSGEEVEITEPSSGKPSWLTWQATPTSKGNSHSSSWDPRNPPKFDSSTVAKMSPQERASYRAARKRARNRQAASRCREKKLKRQSELEDVVQKLTDHNTTLNTQVFALREEVCRLKEEIMQHAQSGCRTILLESSLLTVQRIQQGTNNF